MRSSHGKRTRTRLVRQSGRQSVRRLTAQHLERAVLINRSLFILFSVFSVLLNSEFFSPHEESASSASSLCLGVSVVNFFFWKNGPRSVSPTAPATGQAR